ncbi:hypothetical protein C0993_009714 [Termitomyces sp. T159_Od127]|nr:hypothetical protein C0993_009714 [Termitomyces sp. T159_Od127]
MEASLSSSPLLPIPPNVRGPVSSLWQASRRRRVCIPSPLGSHASPPHSQAYCSEDCQSQDASSPSMSSASSAVSSPNMGYATGADVPPLLPSALGSALTKYARSRHHHSVSTSSASSWSAVTDDEDEPSPGLSNYHAKAFYESADSLYDAKPPQNHLDTIKPSSALSYARRPSGTNNRSMVSNPHPRTTSTHVHDIPRSAPLHSHLSTDDDGVYSDVGFSSRDESEPEFLVTKLGSSQKSKRSRASLPAYFSLLQMTGKRVSPVSSSSNHTISRISPPTPKVALASINLPRSTPRGRRRVADNERAIRSSGESISRSPSRPRRISARFSAAGLSCSREADDEDALDRSSVPGLTRGRPTVRRNSSPLPGMMLSADALNNHNRALAAAAMRTDGAHSPFPHETRGRLKVETDVDAPGYGIGRSGLLHRARAPATIRSGRAL